MLSEARFRLHRGCLQGCFGSIANTDIATTDSTGDTFYADCFNVEVGSPLVACR